MLRVRLRLLLLLLVLLPLQQSWAAMGPYCGEARVHAGLALAALCCDHTELGANTTALPTPDVETVSSHATGDGDCGTCHSNGTAVIATWGAIHAPAGLAATPGGVLATPRPVPAQRPERPQWHALV